MKRLQLPINNKKGIGWRTRMEESEGKMLPVEDEEEMGRITLTVPETLYRAFQRCTWLLINETEKSQMEIMEEMVSDFLVKHGC